MDRFPFEVREDLISGARTYKEALKEYKTAQDLSELSQTVDVLDSYGKEVERLINILKSEIIFTNKWKFIATTYISLESIPLHTRIMNIAKLYSELSVVVDDRVNIIDVDSLMLEESDDDVPVYSDIDWTTRDLTLIPIITYDNVMDAVEFYNSYFNTELTVEDIFKDKKSVYLNEGYEYNSWKLLSSAVHKSNSLLEHASGYITGVNVIHVIDRYILDSYIFGDHKRDFKTLDEEFRDIVKETFGTKKTKSSKARLKELRATLNELNNID